MGDFRKPHGHGGNRGNDRFGRRDFGRSGFGNRPEFSGSRGRNFERSPMYPAVCNKCGRACEVPFRPNGQKPVFCKECFEGTTRGASSQSFERRDFHAPAAPRPQSDQGINELKRQVDAVQSKLDRILQMLESNSRPEEKEEEKKPAAPKKAAKKKKV